MSRLLLFLSLLLAGGTLAAQDNTNYETLRHLDGCRMRAVPITISKENFVSPNLSLALNPRVYPALVRNGINAIRLCWVGPWFEYRNPGNADTWTIPELLEVMDSVINSATRAGMMTIINYHSTGEYENTQGFGRMVPFWRAVAPRYRDNEHVIYEMANEQAFNANTYVSREFESTYRNIYEQIHRDAPEREIIIGSFHSLALPMKRIVDRWTANGWIDWDVTTVGWHFYGAPPNPIGPEEQNLLNLLPAYRSMCTEWDYLTVPQPYIKPFFGVEVMAQWLEENGISWVDWRGWNDPRLTKYTDELLPDAEDKGYLWDLDNCESPNSLTPFADASHLRLYPNPTVDELRIDAAAFTGPLTEIAVYDQRGRILLSRTVGPAPADQVLNVRDLAPGAYYLILRGEQHFARPFTKF